MQFTVEQARAFVVLKQFESLPAADDPVERVIDVVKALGCVQYDPLNVVGRNADLTLQSRIPGYRAAHLHEALYARRALVDGMDKNLAIYAAEDFPALSRARLSCLSMFRANETVRAVLPAVLEAVRVRGALCSDDLPQDEKVRWPWGSARVSRAALETLWIEGRLGLARRAGSRRYYDLIERCLPVALVDRSDPFSQDDDFDDWLVYRRVGALGLLWNRPSDAFLTYDGHMDVARRQAAFGRLVEKGALLPAQVDGLKSTLYLRAADEPLAREAQAGRTPAPVMRALAPLDPMLWDRKLIEALFGFQYRWEVYTPVAKRIHGYYVLPVLLGASFVGRFEPAHYRGGKLEIRDWWKEPDVKETPAYRHAKAQWKAAFQKYCESCVENEPFSGR